MPAEKALGLVVRTHDWSETSRIAVIYTREFGKVRVLATWGESRHPALPDVPTLKELGYDAQFSQWTGLFVPAGTPDAVVAKLREAARAAVSDETFKTALARVETPIQYLDQPQFKSFWDADARKLAEAVRKIGKVE